MRPILPTFVGLSSPQPKPARRALRPPRSRGADPHGARIPTGRAPCGRLPEPHASGSRRAPEHRAHPLPAPSDGLPTSSRFDRFRGHPVGVKPPIGVQGLDFAKFKLFFYTFFFSVFLTCN